jgi:hypothetical protein
MQIPPPAPLALRVACISQGTDWFLTLKAGVGAISVRLASPEPRHWDDSRGILAPRPATIGAVNVAEAEVFVREVAAWLGTQATPIIAAPPPVACEYVNLDETDAAGTIWRSFELCFASSGRRSALDVQFVAPEGEGLLLDGWPGEPDDTIALLRSSLGI